MSGFGRHHQPTQGCSECDAFEASVLLRDSPEDRERLELAIGSHYGVINNETVILADRIIAALRGRNAGFYDDPNAEGNDR